MVYGGDFSLGEKREERREKREERREKRERASC